MDSKKLSSENINDVAEKIKAIVGEANVKINEEKCCICAAVASTEDVAAVSRVANSFGVRISACGGVRLDMSKMNKVEVDAKNYAVKVKAGATWKEIMDAAAAENLMVPSHPFDVDETVGKWIAANTVGIGTYKYGPSKDNVLNVELVLFDGTVIETTTGKDGSVTKTETKTETKPDGTKVETKNETETNKDGSKVESETRTETKKDGTVTESKTETITSKDGTKSETKSETKTDKNGVTSGKETTKTTMANGSTGMTVTTIENGESKTAAEAKVSSKAVEDAKKNGGGDFPTIPAGKYEVKLESMEIKGTKADPNRPMLAVSFKILSGEFKNQRLFMNRVLYGTKNDKNMIASAMGFLEKLDSGVPVSFTSYKQFAQLVLDVAEAIDGTLEYAVDYDDSRFNSITVEEVFEVEN